MAIASVARRRAAASMACYGALLTPRAAVSQRSPENYEIVDQCDCPAALTRLVAAVNCARASAKSFL